MAANEAGLPRTQLVDTVIPMTRGVDKLRTVCGRLRPNAASERFCKNSDSRRFRRWEAPAATRPTVVAPAQGPADPLPGNVDRRCFGIPAARSQPSSSSSSRTPAAAAIGPAAGAALHRSVHRCRPEIGVKDPVGMPGPTQQPQPQVAFRGRPHHAATLRPKDLARLDNLMTSPQRPGEFTS